MKKILYSFLILITLSSCGKDEFAKTNTDPSKVNKPNLSFLFTDVQTRLNTGSYLEWFYDADSYLLPWTQISVGQQGDGNGSDMFVMGKFWDRFSDYYKHVGSPVQRMREVYAESDEFSRSSNVYTMQMAEIMQNIYALKITDLYGDMPYKEACLGFSEVLLSPEFDTQEALLLEMDARLSNSVKVLTNPVLDASGKEVEQIKLPATQDLTYAGDPIKWAKTANALRLRIAARLYHAAPDKAKEIAAEVAQGPIMTTIEDEYRFYEGALKYNFGDSRWSGYAARNIIGFLRDNKDPRVRFIFSKNSFNSNVMQGFLDANLEANIPPYIANNAVIIDDASAKAGRTFVRWKDASDGAQFLGEPWIRYQGYPVQFSNEVSDAESDIYFNKTKFELVVDPANSTKRTFTPVSPFCVNILQPNKDFTYPSVKTNVDEYKPNGNYPYKGTIISAAEVNLYLAEFKTLGANISGSANDYFQKGVELSILSLDRAAREMNVPYYNEPYDKLTYVDASGVKQPVAKPIKLEAGEVAALLAQPDYTLTGDADLDLEKIYTNLIVAQMLTPTDLFVTARRSGLPKEGSTMWAREKFSTSVAVNIPRRFLIFDVKKDNINRENTLEAYARQGFTIATDTPSVLEAERYWYDKNAPAWGAGPIVR